MVPHLSLGTAGVPRLTAKKAKPLAASADDRRRITRRAQGHVPERVSCARAQRRAMNPEPSANPRLAAAKLVADETCVAGVMHACMHACLPAWMHAGRQAGGYVMCMYVCMVMYCMYNTKHILNYTHVMRTQGYCVPAEPLDLMRAAQ